MMYRSMCLRGEHPNVLTKNQVISDFGKKTPTTFETLVLGHGTKNRLYRASNVWSKVQRPHLHAFDDF